MSVITCSTSRLDSLASHDSDAWARAFASAAVAGSWASPQRSCTLDPIAWDEDEDEDDDDDFIDDDEDLDIGEEEDEDIFEDDEDEDFDDDEEEIEEV